MINIMTKDPRFVPRYSVNTFGTAHGETDFDFAAAPRVGSAYTLISGSVAYNDQFVDENGDNFSDLPLNRRVSLFNKWALGPAERRTLDVTDAFYTRFSNKIQPDYNADPNLIVYANLDGFAVTRGLSASAQLDAPSRPYTLLVGASVQDVFAGEGGERRALEFAPDFQGTRSAGYAFRDLGLRLDYTARVVGPMQLPEFPGRATRSPWFSEHHLQATKGFRTDIEIYGAVKNIFNYQQQNPLIDPQDPFGETFDTYYVYGPLQGRRFLLGARYSLGR